MVKDLLYRLKAKVLKTGESWDQLSPSKEEAVEFAHRYINDEPERKLDNHRYSLEYCLAHSGETINNRFRIRGTCDTDLEIEKMVSKNTIDKDIVLYRGVCEYVYNGMVYDAKSIPDCDLYEKAFLSTSLVKGHEINCNIKLRIFVPAGTKAKYLGNVNYEQNFYEVAVMTGAKLKIISKDEEYINCILTGTN